MAKKAYPKAIFKWDLDTETERIIHASLQTANGFYLSKGFYVVNKRINNDASCIYLPDLNYRAHPNYWIDILTAKLDIPINSPKYLYEFVKTTIQPIVKIKPKLLSQTINKWTKVQKEFWATIEHLFPNYANTLGEIEIRLTSFGSLSSYGYITGKSSRKLVTYLREDFGIEQLAEVIITALFLNANANNASDWEISEGFTDFVMKNTKLHRLFPKYVPTLENLRFNPLKNEESKLYLSEIGIPEVDTLEIKNGQLSFGNNCIEQKFTKAQASIIKLLINRQNQLVTYDDIAELIWGDQNADKFSIWAINKHVQRIKDKFIDIGANSSNVHAVKGRGYLYSL